jgi:LysR family transcriptional regulator (chromosome initiation inhibitor)
MFDYAHLEALLAVEREGSFEGAARFLGVTSSAVSQRIKLLEERIGAVVINRQPPIKPTHIGIELCRHAELVSILEDKIINENNCTPSQKDHRKPVIKIVVNDDSISSWFMDVFKAHAWEDSAYMYEVSIADQDYSIDELKFGSVLAAISINKVPVQGFTSRYLGTHVYRASASPEYVKRYFPDGVTLEALKKAPALRYSAQDDLQQQWIHEYMGENIMHDTYILPSSPGFVRACLDGVAWGMNPAQMVDGLIAEGRLVELIPETPLNKPLYWHCSRMVADPLNRFTQHVIEAAEKHLDQTLQVKE